MVGTATGEGVIETRQKEIDMETLKAWFDGGDIIALTVAVAAFIGFVWTRIEKRHERRVASVKVSLAKYVDGNTWNYELTIINLGPAAARDVNLKDLVHVSSSPRSRMNLERAGMLPLAILESGDRFTSPVSFSPTGDDAISARLAWSDGRGYQEWPEPRSIGAARAFGGGSPIVNNVTLAETGMTEHEVERMFHSMDFAKRLSRSRR